MSRTHTSNPEYDLSLSVQKRTHVHQNASIHVDPKDPFVLTLLQAPPHRPQRKEISPQGARHTIPPLAWGVHLIRCTHPTQLGLWLKHLETEPSCILIRGCPLYGKPQLIRQPKDLKPALNRHLYTWPKAQPLYTQLSTLKAVQKQIQKAPGTSFSDFSIYFLRF